MEQAMTLFIADKKVNDLMNSLDMRHNKKQFFSRALEVSFTTTSKVDKDYFLNIIEKSKNEKGYWIPAIEHKGALYVDPYLAELSDGEKSLMLRPYQEKGAQG